MKKWTVTVVMFAAVVYLVSTCFVAVDETQFAIIKQFGRPVRTALEPGLKLKLPDPMQTVVRFDSRLQVFDDPATGMPAKEYLTMDKKNVEVATSTCWRIQRNADSVLKFLETVGDVEGAELRLADIVKSQVNATLGSSNFETLVSVDSAKRKWGSIVSAIHRSCADRALENFGIEVVDLRIQRLNFPAQNRRSVFDRMRAERERIATQYRSEGEADAMRIRAEAQAEQERILAEARAESERIRGKADAEATRIYGKAYGVDPEFYRFLRTLESYEKGLDSDTVLVLPAESEFLRLLTKPDVLLEDPPDTTMLETLSRDGDAKTDTNESPEG